MSTITEIADYLRGQEVEEEIKMNSKERVLRSMAQGVKKNKPLPAGACHFCGGYDERLIPVVMRVCLRCAKRYMNRGGALIVTKKEYTDFHCDACLNRSFHALTINPKICRYCSIGVGKVHKRGIKNNIKERKEINQEKDKLGVKKNV